MRLLKFSVAAAVLVLAGSACSGTAVQDLSAGTCFNDTSTAGQDVSEFDPLDCDAAHDSEVFYTFDVSVEGEYDKEAVFFEVDDTCFAHFEEYVGVAFNDSEVWFYHFGPNEASWIEGERSARFRFLLGFGGRGFRGVGRC